MPTNDRNDGEDRLNTQRVVPESTLERGSSGVETPLPQPSPSGTGFASPLPLADDGRAPARAGESTDNPTDVLVRVEALRKVYGVGDAAVVALGRVSLSIRRSEFVAVMGPSGCGKSTLLHLLGGLDQPTSGRVLVDGVELGALDDDALAVLRRERIGFVFQFFNLIPVLSAVENVALPLILGGQQGGAEPRAQEWLRRVGLADRAGSRPDQLSGGQQQRVALARALVADPALVLADEPTGNLDSRSADEMLRLLRRTADDWGRTVVMVTHDSRMAAYADRVVLMRDGNVVDDALLDGETSVDDLLRKAEATR